MASGLSRLLQRRLGLPGPPPPAVLSRSRPFLAASWAPRPRPVGLGTGCPRCPCPAPAPTCGPGLGRDADGLCGVEPPQPEGPPVHSGLSPGVPGIAVPWAWTAAAALQAAPDPALVVSFLLTEMASSWRTEKSPWSRDNGAARGGRWGR